MWDWFRKLKKRISRGVKSHEILAYYNGPCPFCGEHIGTDVLQGPLKRRSCECGACGKNIYAELKAEYNILTVIEGAAL